MKMIILIIKDSDSDHVTQALTSADYRVTRVASTGGFLRSGVVTLLLGVDAIMDMARTSVNLLGNCLASVVMARWEGEFKPASE